MKAETWTARDEQAMKELADKKKAWMESIIVPVNEIADLLLPIRNKARMIDVLTVNADQIRDALAPLDSGVRVESKKDAP